MHVHCDRMSSWVGRQDDAIRSLMRRVDGARIHQPFLQPGEPRICAIAVVPARNSIEQTPLVLACLFGQLAAAQALVGLGADMGAQVRNDEWFGV